MSSDIYRSARGRDAIAQWCTERLDAWPVPHQRLMITANGAATHAVVAGGGSRTVVFVPGTNFNAASCLPLATALAARSRMVLPDVPGQPGLSSAERAPAGRRLAWYGRWLTDLITQTAEGPAVLVGHSLGAAIALSSDLPLVVRQVLASPGGLVRARTGPGILVPATSWLLRRSPAASARLLETMHAPENRPRRELVDWMTLIARHVRSSLDPGRAVVADRRVDRVVVSGEHDRYFPARALAPALQRSLGLELGVIPSAGHLSTDEQPDRIAALATS
ncbi:alpha/beta hydrolase [Saccharopolyspora sp. NPDC050389]|uniref:alpha/beta fold hydrolase n=1 Tax=Saccharopolyspora sp. NPDC050389 TaxID=3155516 RepID=UPI0033CDA1EE